MRYQPAMKTTALLQQRWCMMFYHLLPHSTIRMLKEKVDLGKFELAIRSCIIRFLNGDKYEIINIVMKRE